MPTVTDMIRSNVEPVSTSAPPPFGTAITGEILEQRAAIKSQPNALAQYNVMQLALGNQMGGYFNTLTGAGGPKDKSAWGGYSPTVYLPRELLEIVYVESWAARKFVNIPVSDSAVRWRSFDNEKEGDDEIVGAMIAAEIRHKVRQRISDAHRLGRLMGTGFLVVVTKDARLSEPIDLDRMGKGELANMIILDRYSAEVQETNYDIWSENYGQPEMYKMHLANQVESMVHESRVLRFDGIKVPSIKADSIYEEQWGVSELVPVMFEIMRDSALIASISHLTDEASIGVMKIRNLREALAGQHDRDRAGPFETLFGGMQYKGNFRTMMVDKNDEFERVSYNFQGLPDLMDRFAERLAAAADIPATRFMGQAPKGMNATGASDEKNYAMTVEALQRRVLDEPLRKLDKILAKDAGLDEAPTYKWHSLIDLSDMDKVEITFKKVQSVIAAVNQVLISEEEGRKILSGDEIFGRLEEKAAFLNMLPNTLNLEGKLFSTEPAPPAARR